MGKFALRGFPEPEELFARSLIDVDSEEYLKPLVAAANAEASRGQGYKVVSRKVTGEFFREFGEGSARPFLARELLNVPKLPYSPKAVVVRGAANANEKEREFFGYFVEWEGTFDGYTRHPYGIDLTVRLGSPNLDDLYHVLSLSLPHTNLETVKTLRKGQQLRARGVINDIFSVVIKLNYVDLEIADD
jgi:hypothetical protein